MTDDIEVKKEDLDAAEKEVMEAAKKKEDEIRKEIEEKLKKDMEAQKKAEEEAVRVKKLEEENSAMQKMLKEEREKKDKEIEILRSEIGQSKAIHTQPAQKPTDDPLNIKTMDNSTIDEISKNSEEAFMERFGLPSNWRSSGKRK